MFSELLSGVFIQGPFVCNALKKLSDERWEKFLGHFSTKGMHCSPILQHTGLRNVECINEKKEKFEATNIYENLSMRKLQQFLTLEENMGKFFTYCISSYRVRGYYYQKLLNFTYIEVCLARVLLVRRVLFKGGPYMRKYGT